MKRKAPAKAGTAANILFFFVLPLALIAGIILWRSLTRSAGVRQALSGFYEALYVEADLSLSAEHLAQERRADFVAALTMGGANEEFYRDYNARAVALYGEDVTIRVSVVSVQNAPGGSQYDASSDDCVAIYTIVMSGSLKSERYENTLKLIKRDGVWYMTDYLPLPVGYNLRVE